MALGGARFVWRVGAWQVLRRFGQFKLVRGGGGWAEQVARVVARLCGLLSL